MSAKLSESFIYMVLSAVEEIPPGYVCSYGEIARLIGHDGNARLVGTVLRQSELYGGFPCHRVVNAQGRLAPGWPEQRFLLMQEGVQFLPSGRVDMRRHLWQP